MGESFSEPLDRFKGEGKNRLIFMVECETRTPFFLKVFLSIFVFLACLIFTTCGLETFYYLDPPIDSGHTTRWDTEDGANAYFSFITNETGSNGSLGGDFNFQGTEVYYNIFASTSTMESVQSSIDSLNTKSDVSAAAESMIKTYGYQNLLYRPSGSSKTRTSTPLIPYSGENRSVYIRLNTPRDSFDIEYMQPAICYSDNYDKDNLLGTPRRKTGSNNYGFEFTKKGSGSSSNPVPTNGDSDLYSSSSSDSTWYIDMWAVSVGRDASYSPSYSRMLHLGSVSIKEEWYDEN